MCADLAAGVMMKHMEVPWVGVAVVSGFLVLLLYGWIMSKYDKKTATPSPGDVWEAHQAEEQAIIDKYEKIRKIAQDPKTPQYFKCPACGWKLYPERIPGEPEDYFNEKMAYIVENLKCPACSVDLSAD